MSDSGTLVSIGLPVRNAGPRVADVAASVMAQDYENLELIISDNGSTDDTEEVCRHLAKCDERIVYHRHPENIGLLNNFRYVMGAASGTYFRWIGDDDRLEPTFVSTCLNVLEADPRLILVTTGISYTGPDGRTQTATYTGTALASDDPIDRLAEMLRLLNASAFLIDPLYGMMRRDRVATIPRRNMLREDEVMAAKLALAGPWRHIPEVLAHRFWKHERLSAIGQRLDIPSWHSHFANTLEVREILRWLRVVELSDDQRRRARLAVSQMYVTRQSGLIRRRARKLVRILTSR